MADNQGGATKELFICPICFTQMSVVNGRYSDDSPVPTLDCSECGFNVPVEKISSDFMEQAIRYKLRLLLDEIVQGEKARQCLNGQPLFPHDRSEQLIALMKNKVRPPLPHPLLEVLTPLDQEDIEDVKRILEL